MISSCDDIADINEFDESDGESDDDSCDSACKKKTNTPKLQFIFYGNVPIAKITSGNENQSFTAQLAIEGDTTVWQTTAWITKKKIIEIAVDLSAITHIIDWFKMPEFWSWWNATHSP